LAGVKTGSLESADKDAHVALQQAIALNAFILDHIKSSYCPGNY
jgi:hypothetical protein